MSIKTIFFLLSQVSAIVLVNCVPARILRSPCPDVFWYEKMSYEGPRDWVFPSEDHRWRGVVAVPPSLPVLLKIKLLTPTALPTKYVGRIELAEDKSAIVKRINQGMSQKIKYYVYFPSIIPIPELVLIQVNSRIICSQPSAPRRLKTILTLEHSLMPITSNISLRGGIGSGWRFPVPEKGFSERETNVELKNRCGKSLLKNAENSGNVSVSIGDWPWMMPLFRKTDLGLHFLCSSTLVSYQYAITAAHCIKLRNLEEIEKEDIVAYAGRFDITNWTEESTQARELSQVFIHPDFDAETLRSDIAILKFSKPLNFSPKINPACVWSGDEDLNAVVGKNGIVFGWGTDGLGRKVTPKPNLAVMPIVSQEECLRSKIDFVYLTSNRTFCAGFRNGTGPCTGDSGGGLLMPVQDDDGGIRWVLRGVVSLSLLQNSEILCDVEDYTVFTDVAKYQTWIRDVMSGRKL